MNQKHKTYPWLKFNDGELCFYCERCKKTVFLKEEPKKDAAKFVRNHKNCCE